MMAVLPMAEARNNGDTPLRIVIACGNKYGFRSVFVPLARDLGQFASIRVYQHDFPADYEIGPVLDELRSSGSVESYSFFPNSQRRIHHYRTLRSTYTSLAKENFDVLIIDADFTPMQQNFIHVARAQGAHVVGLLTWVPHQLLGSFESAILGRPETQLTGAAPRSPLATVKKVLHMMVRQRGRLAGAFSVRLKKLYRPWVHYRLLPLLFWGRTFKAPTVHQTISVFTSKQIDTVIMYTERQKEALQHFYPWMDVRVAMHPLTLNCRCTGQESKTKLLAALGYWSHWISDDNPLEVIEDQWCVALLRAVELKGFTTIDIRPHPRETEPHADRLADRLRTHGVKAQVMNEDGRSFAEVICDYAGVISSPSGALAEAAVACKRAFVIGLDDVNTPGPLSINRITEEGVVGKPRGSQLTEKDFTRLLVKTGASVSVGEVVRSLVMKKAGSESQDGRNWDQETQPQAGTSAPGTGPATS